MEIDPGGALVELPPDVDKSVAFELQQVVRLSPDVLAERQRVAHVRGQDQLGIDEVVPLGRIRRQVYWRKCKNIC